MTTSPSTSRVTILALDPGSTSSGWCLVEASRSRAINVRALAMGEVESTPNALRELLVERLPDVVAVEVLRGIAYPSKGAGIVGNLVSSSFAAGVIVGLARAFELAVVEMPAVQWRRAVLGKANASDREIAWTIPRLVDEWPKRSNAHERDAGGLAVGVAWTREWGPRAPVTTHKARAKRVCAGGIHPPPHPLKGAPYTRNTAKTPGLPGVSTRRKRTDGDGPDGDHDDDGGRRDGTHEA